MKWHASIYIFFLVLFFCDSLLYVEKLNPKEKQELQNWLLGFLYYNKNQNFILISKKYTNRKDIYLHKEAYSAFEKMHAEAKKENIDLKILSAGRNFWYQKAIWEKKWKKEKKFFTAKNKKLSYPKIALKILKYSAMPTSSRHHWGTDIDLFSLNNAHFEKGKGKKIYRWLQKNAKKFNFCQVYSKKNKHRLYGYNEEKWHWSYMPLSRKLLKMYNKYIKYKDIKGFSGAEISSKIKLIPSYVNGINQNCK